jgi:hypothetical protein
MSGNLRIAVATLLLGAAPGFAASVYNYSGTLKADDEIQLFYYSLQNQAQVNVFTTSYAGGGFSPVITVFDSTGLFQDESRGLSGEASLSWVSQPGQLYLVALTQYDNVSFGPLSYFTDGFTQQGQGNFTAQPPFNPPLPGGFYEPGGVQRTGSWALSLTSTDNTLVVATPTPEPGSAALWLGGVAVLAGWKRMRRAG